MPLDVLGTTYLCSVAVSHHSNPNSFHLLGETINTEMKGPNYICHNHYQVCVDVVHCCTMSVCYLDAEMVITKIQIRNQRYSSGRVTSTDVLWLIYTHNYCAIQFRLYIDTLITVMGVVVAVPGKPISGPH